VSVHTGKRSADGISTITPAQQSSSSSIPEVNNDLARKRKKLIDDTDYSTKLEQLKHVSPWVPQFTPQVDESSLLSSRNIEEPLKRPLSPFSGQPLRSKDLISIQLIKESTDDVHSQNNKNSSTTSTVKYICPVSRYVYTII
jgi:hypothetical protein